MLVLLEILDGFEDQDDVVRLRIGRIVGARPLHIDDSFLEPDDLAGGHNRGAFQNERLSFADGLHVADHAGEDLSVPLDLEAGFDDIFHGKDADALSGHGERHVDLGEPFVLGKQLHKLFLIDMKNALFDVRLVSPRQLRNMYLV